MKKSIYLKFILFLSILVFAAASAIAQVNADWKISGYLKDLPKQYKTYEGDISEPTAELTFIDLSNGYAAYLTSPNGNENEVFFEMAMFKPKNGAPTIVVSNYKYDFVCFDYDTFFLQKQGGNWINVRSEVLPNLTQEMFFVDRESYEYYLAQKKKLGDRVGGLTMHFYPPRKGISMDVSLELCDYVDDSVEEGDANSFLTVTDALKTLSLKWNRETAKFEVDTEQD